MEDSIVISIDVEWANSRVLQSVVKPLDERGIKATFFCTHEGIEVPGHERAIHPNFRRDGDISSNIQGVSDVEFYQNVVTETRKFCPEAVGVRPHCLFQDSGLIEIYRTAGIHYDSSYLMPLVSHIVPFRREHGILEFPIYYMDHADITENQTGFELANLQLDRPGLKIFDFHPNIIFTNAPTLSFYEEARGYYYDYERLLEKRFQGKGVRDLYLSLLDYVTEHKIRTRTLLELAEEFSSAN